MPICVVACASRERSESVSSVRATSRGAARAPGAAVWCARPLPILINRNISIHALDERLDQRQRRQRDTRVRASNVGSTPRLVVAGSRLRVCRPLLELR